MPSKPPSDEQLAADLEIKILDDAGMGNPMARRIREMAKSYTAWPDSDTAMALELKILRQKMTNGLHAKLLDYLYPLVGTILLDQQVEIIQEEVRNLIAKFELEHEFPGYQRIADQIVVTRHSINPSHLTVAMPDQGGEWVLKS